MPQPRQRPGSAPQSTGGVPVGDIDPAQAASIRAEVARKEQAPSSQQQTFVDWRKLADQLGQPFEIERIPISKLRAMRRDAMLAFGMAFIKTPHARADWIINARDNNGPNAQVAGNVDWALRRIYASFVNQFFLSLDFGWASIAKRFEERVPAGTYLEINQETGERTEEPLWSEGGIKPIVWKPFVALPPETVEPIWNSDGEFDGISFKPPAGGGAPAGTGAKGNEEGWDIPLSHSLWVTNERESVFNNMYGYPRLGYSYRYWWSYWFRWAIADRAFEKKGDPSIVVKHPEGESYDPAFGGTRPNSDIAMDIGDRVRSGGVITMPSDVYMGEVNGSPSAQPMWDVSALKDMLDFDPFDSSFEYLDVMKLRSLWVPEQAFLEGKGGTSSRNVASEMGDSFMEQQRILSQALADHLNRWVIPQFLAVNFPEFIAAGGTAEFVHQGFARKDIDGIKRALELIAQQERGARDLAAIVDMQEAAEAIGLPVRSFAEQERIREEIEAEQQALNAPETAPVPGAQVGVMPTATGFAYVNPPERLTVTLASDATDFLENLPDTVHYQDRQVRQHTRLLFQTWADALKEDYRSFAHFLTTAEANIAQDEAPGERATAIIEAWTTSSELRARTLERSKLHVRNAMDKAASIARQRAGYETASSAESRMEWADERVDTLQAGCWTTSDEELRRFLAQALERGDDLDSISKQIGEHFADFPTYRAARIARTEIRDAYNEAVIQEAQANRAKVQGIDEGSEEDSSRRDGKIFTPTQARKQKDHPNGLFGVRPVPAAFSVKKPPEDAERVAWFDAESSTVYLHPDLDDDKKRAYLKAVVDHL